jgi:hypothetical protein
MQGSIAVSWEDSAHHAELFSNSSSFSRLRSQHPELHEKPSEVVNAAFPLDQKNP